MGSSDFPNFCQEAATANRQLASHPHRSLLVSCLQHVGDLLNSRSREEPALIGMRSRAFGTARPRKGKMVERWKLMEEVVPATTIRSNRVLRRAEKLRASAPACGRYIQARIGGQSRPGKPCRGKRPKIEVTCKIYFDKLLRLWKVTRDSNYDTFHIQLGLSS